MIAWKKLFLSAAAAALLPLSGETLLKNQDFSDLTAAKLPRGWDIRGDLAAFSAVNKSITLGGKKNSSITVIQRGIPLKKGVPYQVKYHAAGKAKYLCYMEYSYMVNGKQQLSSFHSSWMQAIPQGKTEKFPVLIPREFKNAYLVILVKSSEEKVTISDLKLEDRSAAAAAMVQNCDFTETDEKGYPVNWKCRGGKVNEFRFSADKAELKGEGAYLIANVRQAPGAKGRLSYTVSGKGKYRVYLEWYWQDQGKNCASSTGVGWHEATKKPEMRTLDFEVPAYAKTCILAFNSGGEGPVTFSQVRVTPRKNQGDFALDAKKKIIIPLGKLKEGRKYRYSYQVRGIGATGSTTTFHFLRIQLNDVNGTVVAFPEEDTLERFQNKHIDFTAPKTAASLAVTSLSDGTLFFRNCKLELLPEPVAQERLVLTSPMFRDTFYSSTNEKTVEGTVFSVRHPVKSEVLLTADSGKKYTASLKQDGKVWKFSLPGETGKLTVTLHFAGGKEAVLTKKISRAPKAAVEVVTGSDRRIRINGKPFLPVTFWSGIGGFYALARNGVNSTFVFPSTAEEFLQSLNKADKYGIKLVFALMFRAPKKGDENSIRLWAHQLDNLLTKEVRNHPAFLGYFLEDEPCWSGRPVTILQQCYALLRTMDPYRPIWINAAPRRTVEEQRPYSDCSDIYGLDIYPVPWPNKHSHLDDKTMSCVGKYVHWLEEVTSNKKPVMMCLQGFSWKDMKERHSNEGYPTWLQSRFMAFDALINGSDAVTWWGLHYVRKAEFLVDLLKVTREVHAISGALLSQNDIPGKVSNPAVEYRRYFGKGWSLVIAANTVEKTSDAVFTGVPGISGKQNFAPYEVKMFRVGTLPAPAWKLPPAEPGMDDIKPFTEALSRVSKAAAYKAPAGMKWIWGEKESRVAGSRVFVKKEFTVAQGLKKASLHFVVDDLILKLQIDGKSVGDPDKFMKNWRYLENLTVTKLLKPGKHTLLFEVKDGGVLPCGLLAELLLEYKDGKTESIFTDKNWLTSPVMDGPWAPAGEVRSVGDSPWGNPALLQPLIVQNT